MTVLGSLLLLGSLFLTWSHQVTPALRHAFPDGLALDGVPASPTAWQVYSAMDVALALLAVGLAAAALWGGLTARLLAAAAACVGLAFTVHALLVPPTNGLLLVRPGSTRYFPVHPTPGVGEALALAGLVLALTGLAVSALPSG